MMNNTEDELATGMRRQDHLSMILQNSDGRWDSVPLDCPPNLGVLNNAALVIGNILTLAQAKTMQIRAIKLLFTQHHRLSQRSVPLTSSRWS